MTTEEEEEYEAHTREAVKQRKILRHLLLTAFVFSFFLSQFLSQFLSFFSHSQQMCLAFLRTPANPFSPLPWWLEDQLKPFLFF